MRVTGSTRLPLFAYREECNFRRQAVRSLIRLLASQSLFFATGKNSPRLQGRTRDQISSAPAFNLKAEGTLVPCLLPPSLRPLLLLLLPSTTPPLDVDDCRRRHLNRRSFPHSLDIALPLQTRVTQTPRQRQRQRRRGDREARMLSASPATVSKSRRHSLPRYPIAHLVLPSSLANLAVLTKSALLPEHRSRMCNTYKRRRRLGDAR